MIGVPLSPLPERLNQDNEPNFKSLIYEEFRTLDSIASNKASFLFTI